MCLEKFGLIAFATLVAFIVSPKIAAADDGETCTKQSGDIAIAACSRAIASGKYRGRNLAILYYNRGLEWRAKGDLDRAIAEYDEAIRLDPKYVLAYNN